MKPNLFKLEEYFAQYEFNAPYLLCCSDAETFTLNELLLMADPKERKLWEELKLSYTETKGLPILREEIAKAFYPTKAYEHILCFAGAEEGIFLTLSTLLEPGDHVVVLTPCYQSLIEIPKMQGCSITTIPLLEEEGWQINCSRIAKALQPKTKCVIINFPHNPTGQIISPTHLQELVDLLKEKGIWLFSDEVYRHLGPSPSAPPASEMYSRGISLSVMSKSFGLAGLRVGWIASENTQLLKNIEEMKYYTSICNSAPSEILSLIALKNKDQILLRNNQIVEKNISLLDQFFKDHSSLFSWVRPNGGCTGFVNYKGPGSVDDFCAKLVKECGVLLMPASVYDTPTNHFRIGFGRKDMPDALEKLKNFLRI